MALLKGLQMTTRHTVSITYPTILFKKNLILLPSELCTIVAAEKVVPVLVLTTV